MSFPIDQIPFKRNAVEPVECIKRGWELVKPQYWLFVGIVIVGMLVASVVPLYILMGPMMCGIYMALLQTRRGNPIEFGILFKGFDHFGDALIATLLHMVPIMVLIVPTYIGFYVGIFVMAGTSRTGEPDPGMFLGFVGIFGVIVLLIMVLVIALSVLFTFAYPLIVDRKLSGFNAVKLSIRAGLANFWPLLGMMLLTGLLTACGVMLCFVGIYLVVPVTYAAIATAYEQVFGLSEIQSNLPPPPPTFY
jgi:uncharacterized membrane protein